MVGKELCTENSDALLDQLPHNDPILGSNITIIIKIRSYIYIYIYITIDLVLLLFQEWVQQALRRLICA